MNVKLVSYTKPYIEELLQGSEGIGKEMMNIISYCGRVSNPKNQENVKTADALIRYLKKHKHWSPFEMVDLTFEINTTRDIARQILRHRSFSFQEFSQRYANPLEQGLTFVIREARLQDTKNRQNSIEIPDATEIQTEWAALQQSVIDVVTAAYTKALEMGIAKEVARAVLPEGMTESRVYMKGSVRSWIHFLEVRTGEDTQKEHRIIAQEIARVMNDLFGDYIV